MTSTTSRLASAAAAVLTLAVLSPPSEYATGTGERTARGGAPVEVVVRASNVDALAAELTRRGGEIRYRSVYTDALLVALPDAVGPEHAVRDARGLPGVRDAWLATRIYASSNGRGGPKKLDRGPTGKKGKAPSLVSADPTSDDGSSGRPNPAKDDLARWSPALALSEQPAPDAALAPLWDLQWDLKLAWVGYAWSIADNLGDGVTVAVLDTGVSPTASLPASRIAPGADFIDPGTPPADDNGHGTHMASIIAASGAAAGVAPSTRVVPVRVLDAELKGTELALVDGLHYVASLPDVDVVNMSLSFPAGYYPSPLLTDAIDAVRAKGIVMVAAAGNDGSRTVGYPARFPEVIAVGSQALTYDPTNSQADSDFYGSRPAYSNTGGALDLCALGGDLTQDANADGVPDGILGARPATSHAAGGIWLTAGTSPASAEVAGAAALLIANGIPARSVREVLMSTAYRGYSSGNFTATVGAGLLNVGRALEMKDNKLVDAPIASCFANPVVVFVADKHSDATFPAVVVEVTDADRVPIVGADVYVHFGGQHDDHAMHRTNDDGQALVTSNVPLAPGEGLVAVTIDAVVAEKGRAVCRPIGTFEVDRLSYELLSNLGAGLVSSALVLDLDPQAVAKLPLVDASKVQRTLQLRSLGASTTSLPIVFGATASFYEDHLAGETMLFHTWGTGLTSSALILDRAYFAEPVRAEWGSESLTVRSYTTGSGLTSSALVWEGATYPLDTFFTGTTPRVFSMTTGTGLVSSALVWDGAGILATDLDANLRQTSFTEPGTAASTNLQSFDKATASLLGARWADWSSAYPSGTGLISSALVANFDPFRQLARLDGLAPTLRAVYRGTSDASIPLDAAP